MIKNIWEKILITLSLLLLLATLPTLALDTQDRDRLAANSLQGRNKVSKVIMYSDQSARLLVGQEVVFEVPNSSKIQVENPGILSVNQSWDKSTKIKIVKVQARRTGVTRLYVFDTDSFIGDVQVSVLQPS